MEHEEPRRRGDGLGAASLARHERWGKSETRGGGKVSHDDGLGDVCVGPRDDACDSGRHCARKSSAGPTLPAGDAGRRWRHIPRVRRGAARRDTEHGCARHCASRPILSSRWWAGAKAAREEEGVAGLDLD